MPPKKTRRDTETIIKDAIKTAVDKSFPKGYISPTMFEEMRTFLHETVEQYVEPKGEKIREQLEEFRKKGIPEEDIESHFSLTHMEDPILMDLRAEYERVKGKKLNEEDERLINYLYENVMSKKIDPIEKSDVSDLIKYFEEKKAEKESRKAFDESNIKELITNKPEIADEILEDIDKSYIRGEISKEEYDVLTKSIPEELKNIKIKKKRKEYTITQPKIKVATKEIRDIIKERKGKNQKRRIKFI